MDKYLILPLRKRWSALWVQPEELKRWMERWKFFFILGFGRSGTNFLANLLDSSPGAYVFHEPVFEDFFAHVRAHYNQNRAKSYIASFRLKEIYQRMRGKPDGIYGEVNPLLRCHAPALQDIMPDAALIHLIRDGREVIRSTMSRTTMTWTHPFSSRIHPTREDPWWPYWHTMDRFSRVCWFWQEENSRLRAAIGRTVQFEKLLVDYDYFQEQILEPCHLTIEQDHWKSAVQSPRNITPVHHMPQWEDWSPEQQNRFIEICGEEMANCGYEI